MPFKNSDSEKPALRVLLIDDDVDFVDSMSGILEIEGYRVETAHSADEASAGLKGFDPEVALVDIRLGQENGLELVSRLQKEKPALTCVVVTAYADVDTAIQALKAGAYDYLRKPFEARELFAVLRRCADRIRLVAGKEASERAQKESEARFRVAFDTSPDAILLAYPGGSIIEVNAGFERMTGYRSSEVVGHNSMELGLWKNPAIRKEMQEHLEKFGQANNLEAEFRLSDGQIRYGLVSARIVQLGGERVGLYVVRDIHDLKQKERAILESEERFRSLVAHIPGAVFRCRLDPEFTMDYISSPIGDISGYTPIDFVQNKIRSFASVIHPDDRELVFNTASEAISRKSDFSVEFRIIHADGSTRWVYQKGQGSFDADGQLKCIDGVIFDTTESTRALQELAQSEDRIKELYQEYNTVLEGIPDAIMLIDSGLKIVWGNHGASRHLGIDQDEIAGKSCADVWKCHATNCASCLQEAFQYGKPVETVQKTADGRTCGVKFFPIKDRSGQVENVVQIISDLTEKMRLREQASRSAHLAALGELAAGVAHEINNPTGMILVEMPLLKDAVNDLLPLLEKFEPELAREKIAGLSYEKFRQEVPAVIDEIEEGAQRIKRIVEDLKEFSAPSSDENNSIDLNEVVKKAVNLVRNPLKQATDHFSEQYADDHLFFPGNTHRIEQVIINLLLNACQALPDRSKGIKVATAFGQDKKSVKVTVSDEGAGIAPELLKQITDPFFTTRRKVGGTGLGLSVSSRIIDEHKGTISFDSEPGSGTEVTVELPIVRSGSGDE